MQFVIEIIETQQQEFIVDAKNKEDAIDIANKKLRNDNFSFGVRSIHSSNAVYQRIATVEDIGHTDNINVIE